MRLLLCLALVACARTPVDPSVAQQTQPRCTGMVEVFPNGMSPARPYRVLGSVQTQVNDNQTTAAEQSLMRDACRMGADAIILEARDLQADNSAFGSSGGLPSRSSSYLAATAVAYTDVTPAPAQ